MNRILHTAGVVMLATVSAVVAIAAAQPDTYRVERSARIAAPADRIHPLIDDLRRFNDWNPFEDRSAGAPAGRYEGSARGAGAAYAYGGGKSGSGRIEVVRSAPAEIAMRLVTTEPIASTNDVRFTLVPRGAATEVTWTIEGAQPFARKLFAVFLDVDAMCAAEFDKGLAALKAIAERA